MNTKLKILHLEDLASDAELVERELLRSSINFEIRLVKNKTDFTQALTGYPADIILSDHSLPSMTSADALQLVHKHQIKVPFILITATISEEYAVEIMKMGAYDYILKDRLQRLPHAIENALEKWRHQKEKEIYLSNLIQSEQKFRGLIENGGDLIKLLDENFRILYRGPNYQRITGWASEDMGATFNKDLIHPDDQQKMLENLEELLKNPGKVFQIHYRLKHKAGHYLWLEGTMINLLNDSSLKGIVSNFRDVTERKNAEEQLQQSRYLLSKATEVAHIGYFFVNAKTNLGYWSDEVCRIYGIEPGTFDGRTETFLNFIHEKDRESVYERIQQALRGEIPYKLDHRIVRKDGSIRWVHHTAEVSFTENGEPEDIIGITQEVTERKTMEEILREFNDRFEIVSKATNDAIWDWDIEKDVILWNHGIKTIFGFDLTINESTNEWWSAKLHPSDYKRITQELWETFNNNKTNWTAHYQYKCADGSYKHVLDRAYVIYSDNRPIRMIGAMQDITQQKKATEEIEKLSLVASKTNNPVMITDRAGGLEWVNQAFTNLTEYTNEEVKGVKPGVLLQGPETDKTVVKRIKQKLEAQQEITEELLNYAKSGRKFWVRLSISPIFDSYKTLTHFIAVVSDITDQKEFEVKITSIARELTNIIENANVPIFGVDRNGYINDWNKITAEISGFSKNEVLGKKWLSLLDISIHAKVVEIIEKVLLGNPVSNYELPFTNKEGKRIILLISISPRRDANNNIQGIICLGQDLTEVTLYRKGLEKLVGERTRELNTALQKEKELVELKSKFVSIASHEFRTPLSSISLATGFIRKYKDRIDLADIDKKLEHIERQVQHMVYLLDDVLLVGKADAGKIHAKLSPVNVTLFKELIEEVAKSTGKNHVLDFIYECPHASIVTDEKLIRNIFINLITNSIKFSPEAKKINVTLRIADTSFIFIVQDFGIGIPDVDLKNLFQSFSRASNVGTIEGTGLGLSIVKKAVELLNGSIDVKSKLGEGTTFTVTIPLYE